jgi:hypothetical protein
MLIAAETTYRLSREGYLTMCGCKAYLKVLTGNPGKRRMNHDEPSRPIAIPDCPVAGGLVIGVLPLFVGLTIAMPVLGHATWHLYRKVVPR